MRRVGRIARSVEGTEVLTDWLSITGGGTVDLRSRELDLAFRPTARAGVDDAARAALIGEVRVRGPFDAPVVVAGGGDVLGRAATFGGGAVATLSGARFVLDALELGEKAPPGPGLCRPP